MKTCDVSGCSDPVFGTDKNTGKRFCKRHQHLRTDTIKRIRKKSVKERNEKLLRNKINFDFTQWGFSDEREMFDSIWNDRPHVSEISGRDLDQVTLYFSMFAHILPKGQFPLFRYNPDNIMLVHPIEHVLIDQGSSSARKNYKKNVPQANFGLFYDRKQKLLIEYPGGKNLNALIQEIDVVQTPK